MKTFKGEWLSGKELKSKKGVKEERTIQRTNDRGIQQTIAEKAYELYEKRGRKHGHDLEDWLEADQLILSESEDD